MVETPSHRLVSYTLCVNHFLEDALLINLVNCVPSYPVRSLATPATHTSLNLFSNKVVCTNTGNFNPN